MATAMDESTFDRHGRDELAYLEDRLGEVDPDDVEIASAWHFDPPAEGDPEQTWRTPDGQELRRTLQTVIRQRVGLEVEL